MTTVGAVFDDRASASAAADALRRIGVADDETVTAAWSGERYVVDVHAGRDLGRTLSVGALIGLVVGMAIGAVLALVVWRSVSDATAMIAGGGVGGLLGAILGGYLGMSRHREKLWDQRDWTHLDLVEGQLLVVVDTREMTETAEAELRQNGGRIVEPVHPGNGV